MKIKKIKILGFITIYKTVTYSHTDKVKKAKLSKKDKLQNKIKKLEGDN